MPARKTSAKKTSSRKAARTPASKKRATVTRTKVAPAPRIAAQVPELALEGMTPETGATPVPVPEPDGALRLGFLGCGRCGGRLAEAFWRLGYRRVLALHMVPAAHDECTLPAGNKLLLDAGPRGPGKDMEEGRRAFEAARDRVGDAVERIFAGEVDQLFVMLGTGGGTGGGAVAGLLELPGSRAGQPGLDDGRVGVICTLPTAAETAAPRVAANVRAVTAELMRRAGTGTLSPLLVIDNDRIDRMYPDLTVADFLPTINESAGGLLDIFNRLCATAAGFDGKALAKLLRAGGWSVMGLAMLDPTADTDALAAQVRAKVPATLLAGGFDLATASAVGVLAVGPRGTFAGSSKLRRSLPAAIESLRGLTGKATLSCGILEDDRPGLRLYTIVGGLAAPEAASGWQPTADG